MLVGVTSFFLGISAVMDFLWKKIWWPVSLVFMTGATAFHFVAGDKDIGDILAGILLGAGLLLVSWISREAIGYGDGLTVAACGAALGFTVVFPLLMLAFVFSAIWSCVLLVLKKAGKKDSFPFIPFLLAAQLCFLTF